MGYDQELAKHASYAAAEMDEMHRSLERYIFGYPVTTITDIEPHAGQVDHTPPEYSAYAYPVGKAWPSSYPAPETPVQPVKAEVLQRPAAVMSMDRLMLLLPPPASFFKPSTPLSQSVPLF